MATDQRPVASLSLDLDNLWSYMKTHGEAGWESFPTYLDKVVPAALDVLDRLGLSITFFIVGQDAALEKNREALHSIVERGMRWEITPSITSPGCTSTIGTESGRRSSGPRRRSSAPPARNPGGFAAPASAGAPISSTCSSGAATSMTPPRCRPTSGRWREPTIFGPRSQRRGKEKEGRAVRELERRPASVKPFFWQLSSGAKILEIPVTTMPVFKVPFHLSYLIYLSGFSAFLMSTYLRMAVLLCRLTKTAPSFLLHPLDLIGCDQVSELAFFPGDGPARRAQGRPVRERAARSVTALPVRQHEYPRGIGLGGSVPPDDDPGRVTPGECGRGLH